MKPKYLLVLAAFLLLAVAGCNEQEVKESLNNAADAPATGIPAVDTLKALLGVGLAVGGYRTTKALYGAAKYPGTPFTDAEINEMAVGLIRLGYLPPHGTFPPPRGVPTAPVA